MIIKTFGIKQGKTLEKLACKLEKAVQNRYDGVEINWCNLSYCNDAGVNGGNPYLWTVIPQFWANDDHYEENDFISKIMQKLGMLA